MKRSLQTFFIILFFSSALYSQNRKPERYPDDPSARVEYDFLRLRDPATGEIPPLISRKEFEFSKTLPKKNPAAKGSLQSQFEWQSIGPINVCGRVQAIGIDIKNESNMLAGTASGGVWRSIDAGQSWVKVTLPNEEETISAIVQDTRPGMESTWYYSTGELLSTTGRRETTNIRTHSWGNGIYKSTDNGATWNPLLSTITTNGHSAPENFTGIWNLALDTKNLTHSIIYAACYGGIMRSSDGGSSWTNVLGGDSLQCFNSEIARGTGGTLYAAIGSTSDGRATPHQGVWRSTDGISWIKISTSVLPALLRRIRLAVSASSDTILYCLTEAPDNFLYADTEFVTTHSLSKYSYLSGNGSGSGGNWESRTVPFDQSQIAYNNSLGGYCLVLAVHPDNPEEVLIGGNDLYYSSNGFRGSQSFYEIGGYPYNLQQGTLHPDMHALVFSRSNPTMIYVGSDGGVSSVDNFITDDQNWVTYNNGLTAVQVYHSSLDRGTDGDPMIVSGFQDNSSYLTTSTDPNEPWSFAGGGDGMTTAVSPGGTVLFTSWQDGNIDCFYNDGTQYTYKGFLTSPGVNSASTFFTNFILEPNNGDELYQAETDHLWRFDDIQDFVSASQGATVDPNWNEVTEVYPVLHAQHASITTFGFAVDRLNRLFFGTNTGKVFQVDSANAAKAIIKDISGSGFPANGFVAGIEVNPADANEIIVVFSNYHVQSLFRTTNGGVTWDPIGGNLEELPDGAGSGPSLRCAKILQTPSGGFIYYVGTSIGLYSATTINGMQTVWTQEGPATLGNLIVESLDARQSDGKVVVSTQGGGVFVNIPTNDVKDRQNSSNQIVQVAQNFPNPFTNKTTIDFRLSKRSDVVVEMYNALGNKISTMENRSFNDGMNSIEIASPGLPSGNYFLRFSAGGSVTTKMITIEK